MVADTPAYENVCTDTRASHYLQCKPIVPDALAGDLKDAGLNNSRRQKISKLDSIGWSRVPLETEFGS